MDDSMKELLTALSFGLEDDAEMSEKGASFFSENRPDTIKSLILEDRRQKQETFFPDHVRKLIPDWIEYSDEVDEEEESSQKSNATFLATSTPTEVKLSSCRLACLEKLGPDVASNLLAHLHLTDLSNVSLVSKALYQSCRLPQLWRSKFLARWNFTEPPMDWFQAYQAAYANTHDLWITHYNIVPPHDGDSPGKCCILQDDIVNPPSPDSHACPTCRYSNIRQVLDKLQDTCVEDLELETVVHAMAVSENKSTPARVIQAATMYSAAKWCHNTKQLPRCRQTQRRSPRRAFQTAATFHRIIDTRQYEYRSLHFLTDVLFFNVCPSVLEQRNQQELELVKQELYDSSPDVTEPEGAVTHLGLELTQHTWHIVRFHNPDHVRPITFRILVQRPDCFTVYPSEGYLEPGESCYIFLGVRLLGGLMSNAYEALNVEREAVDPFLANVYAHEAHLPYAPFCVRYMFCAVTPCIPPLFSARGGTKRTTSQKCKNVVSYLWEHVATESTVRTLYISAHVNANYSYLEFCRDTLVPFPLETCHQWRDLQSKPPLVHAAPNLMHRYPHAFAKVNNMKLEIELSDAGEFYRTERNCSFCHRDWGVRAEELGRLYLLHTLVCIADEREQNMEMHNFVFLLRRVHTIVENNNDNEDWDNVYRVLYALHGVLTKYRAKSRVSKSQRKLMLQLEVVVDHLCQIVQVYRGFQEEAVEDGPMTWRHVGVYRYLKSTDSIFESSSFFDDLLEWKDEPEYLDGFRHLCHNPGSYCLGQQLDPNHEDREILVDDIKTFPLKRAFLPKRRDKASDIFMDDTTLSFASALAMIHDPRSLIVHGVYDRVFAPGTISRRPSFPSPLFSRPYPVNKDSVVSKARKVVQQMIPRSGIPVRTFPSYVVTIDGNNNFWLRREEIDPEGIDLTHIHSDSGRSSHKSAFQDFIKNIPPPGTGKFAFNDIDEKANRGRSQIAELTLTVDHESQSPSEVTREAIVAPVDIIDNQEGLNHLLIGPRGPRLFNLFWLLSSHLGWSIQASHGGSPVMVERRILIASQWVANSAMAMPVLYTLMARQAEWISAKPIDYHLEGLPYEAGHEMRYFSPKECGLAAIVVFLLWLMMGRYSERKIGRTFERSMMEHLSPDPRAGFLRRLLIDPISIWIQRRVDRLLPIFLQRLVFTPRWNRRTSAEITDHIRSWRSKDMREHRSSFPSDAGLGVITFGRSVEDGGPPVGIWEESSPRKVITGLLVALGSFSACSPHFILNVLTVFCCSIGLGMSVSLQSMETGRGIPSSANNPPGRSIFRPFGLNTIVIGFFLMGQLVGSSGGILFLAEFVVTSVSLVLGGAGTISASAMESWCTFFCLSSASFWGYVFARVALMDGIRHKKRGASGVFLCGSLIAISLLWMLTLLVWEWDTPPGVMIVHDILVEKRPSRKRMAQQLQ